MDPFTDPLGSLNPTLRTTVLIQTARRSEFLVGYIFYKPWCLCHVGYISIRTGYCDTDLFYRSSSVTLFTTSLAMLVFLSILL